MRAAVAALADLSEVDETRLGAVGVCAGAGYLAPAVAEEERIGAFAWRSFAEGGGRRAD